MGLFDRHDYGRDFRGAGRGPGGRMRRAWNPFEDRLEGGMDRGYDRGFRGRGGYDATDFAYRGLDGAWSTARNRGAHDVQWDWRAAGGSRYDQDLGRPWDAGYDREFIARAYDRDFGAHGYDRGLRPDPMLGRTRFGGARREWREMGPGGPDRYDLEYRRWNSGWRRGR